MCLSLFSSKHKTIIKFGFCGILNNQGFGPRPSARLITLTETLIIPDISKTSSNNCLIYERGNLTTSDFGKRLGLDFLSGFTGLVWTEGRFVFKKKCGFKNIWIRVDETLITVTLNAVFFKKNFDKELSYWLHLSYIMFPWFDLWPAISDD